MIGEWFYDSLRENGHLRLGDIVRMRKLMTPERALEVLKTRWDSVYEIVEPFQGQTTYENSARVKRILKENGTDLGEWTSFIADGETVVFAFRSAQAAVQFRLIWP